MTESQKIQAELDTFNAARKAEKLAGDKYYSNWPVIERTFTYRTTPAIKANDIGAL